MKKPYTLSSLASYTNSQLVGNPNYEIQDVADLESATAEDASFLSNLKYTQAMRASRAGVVFIPPGIPIIEGRNFLINDNPSKAFQKLLDVLHTEANELTGFTGIHPTAVIHPTATIGENVTIGPHAVIDKKAVIGKNSHLGANCFVGPYTTTGEDCIFHPNVTVRERCRIGNRVILQPGVVIGSCGYGYLTNEQGKHTKLNQVGTVFLEDDVEIGANTTIDRARFKTTRIGRGTKLDNLIQIAHGVELGEDNLLAALTGVAGSTKTGRCVMAGGHVAIGGHLQIESFTMIAAKSGVSKSLSKGKYNGVPAMPLHEYNRIQVYLRNIEKYVKQLQKLQIKMHCEN